MQQLCEINTKHQALQISFRYVFQRLEVEIETQRLYIRSYKDEDFENCVSLYGDETITKYFDHGKPRSRLEVKNLINEKAYYFYKGSPFGLFSIFNKQEMNFIGQVDLIPTIESGTVEIGFIIHKKYHNQGFATEVAKTFLFGYVDAINRNFKTFDITRVVATTHPKNLSSRKVLENSGMTFHKLQKRFGAPRLWFSFIINSESFKENYP